VRRLVFDPFAGISGDMVLGGLLDLGLPIDWLRGFVADLELGEIRIDAERVDRCGISCTRLRMELPHEHAHRHLSDVVRIIEGTGVESAVRERAILAFTMLAESEAEVHGTTVERVHFHEVGALDAIVDVLASMAGCAELGFEAFHTRPVTVGRGLARMAHGLYPVPPPATLKLLQGIEVRDPGLEGECTTPTGAAILRALTHGQGAPAAWVPRSIGFGAGARNPDDRPNCLRLIVVDDVDGATDRLLMLQADMDDLEPEYTAPLIQEILDAGALDCTVTPTLMKKGRTGIRVEALLRPESRESVGGALFRASTSIGYRWWQVERAALPRSEATLEWRGHSVRIKRSRLPDGGIRAKPEFEDVVLVATALGITPFAAYRAIMSEVAGAGE